MSLSVIKATHLQQKINPKGFPAFTCEVVLFTAKSSWGLHFPSDMKASKTHKVYTHPIQREFWMVAALNLSCTGVAMLVNGGVL